MVLRHLSGGWPATNAALMLLPTLLPALLLPVPASSPPGDAGDQQAQQGDRPSH